MSKKVFELAKELDMGPLDLVELLKTKGFAVRNHMAELSTEDVEKFLQAMKKEKEDEKPAVETKKKVVRKKVTTTAEPAKAAEKKVEAAPAVVVATEKESF